MKTAPYFSLVMENESKPRNSYCLNLNDLQPMQAVLCAAVLLLLSLLFLQPAHGEIYKWVDENGKTQYGDRPSSENADVIQLKKETFDSGNLSERADKRQKLLDVLQEERKEKQELKKRRKSSNKNVRCWRQNSKI